jgi:hypothetical protein
MRSGRLLAQGVGARESRTGTVVRGSESNLQPLLRNAQSQNVPGFEENVGTGRLRCKPEEGQNACPGAECRSRASKQQEHYMQESGGADTNTISVSQRGPSLK